MKVPFSWLGEFVELDQGPDATAEMLTGAGMKVERIHRLGQGLEGVVAGTVLEIEPHPNADKLTLVKVEAGGRTLRIVCGASNFAIGDKVPVALPGSRLPAAGKLEARKIRGIASEGMLCSPMELGYGQDHSGILVLEPSAESGRDVRELLGLDETVLELEITPNRPDAMSLIGIAREVAACTGAQLIEPSFSFREEDLPVRVTVHVEDPGGCPRYIARVFEGVRVGPSPEIVRRRLSLSGIRPISNVVDATNYALLITGQPMHAFDLDRLTDSTLVVRRASPGEKLLGIDLIERILDPDDLIIADRSGPVALAGVMGGAETAVSSDTTRIALESAFFDPASIFRASKRHGLRTESSARFERGADPNNVEFAAGVAASFLTDWAGGVTASFKVDFYPAPVAPEALTLRPRRAAAVLGMQLNRERMMQALSTLGLKSTPDGDLINVEVPTRRRDLVAEEDLIEEIARVIGYDEIPSALPAGRNRAALPSTRRQLIQKVNSALTGAGLTEARNSILVGSEDLLRLRLPASHFTLSNPLTKDESVLRPSLLPGLVASVTRNFARRNLDVRLYEIGSIFVADNGRAEPLRLGIALGGQIRQEWHSVSRTLDFYDLKGVAETLLGALGREDAVLVDGAPPPFHPRRSAEVVVEGTKVGVLGQIGNDELKAIGADFPIQLAEFDLEELEKLAKPLVPGSVEGAKFPAVLLDLAISVPESVTVQEVEATAVQVGGQLLEGVRVKDVYRGEQVGAGRKSFAFSLLFRRPDRTLTESEALEGRDEIADAIERAHGGHVRR